MTYEEGVTGKGLTARNNLGRENIPGRSETRFPQLEEGKRTLKGKGVRTAGRDKIGGIDIKEARPRKNDRLNGGIFQVKHQSEIRKIGGEEEHRDGEGGGACDEWTRAATKNRTRKLL